MAFLWGYNNFLTGEGKYRAIADLVIEKRESIKGFGYNIKTGEVEHTVIHSFGISHYIDDVLHIVLSNVHEIRCDPEQLFLMQDGTYTHGYNLYPGCPLMRGIVYTNNFDVTQSRKYFGIREGDFIFGDNVNYPKVTNVYINKMPHEAMYTFKVDSTHNALLSCMGGTNRVYTPVICVQ